MVRRRLRFDNATTHGADRKCCRIFMNAYKTIRTSLTVCAIGVLVSVWGATRVTAAAPPKPLEPVPSASQLAWQEDELTLFTHFGMNTFTGRGTGLGTEDPKLFYPTNLDCRQ